jgi:hypothetical protein
MVIVICYAVARPNRENQSHELSFEKNNSLRCSDHFEASHAMLNSGLPAASRIRIYCPAIFEVLCGVRAMSEFDWRAPESFKRVQDADITAIAWEYLRRNPDYRRDYEEMAGARRVHHVTAGFRRRWGLCFRA